MYPGVDVSRLIPTDVYTKDFVIPGRIMWTKNLQLAIDAFRIFLKRRPDRRDFTLTLAGYIDRKSQPYFRMLRDRAADCPQIRFIVSPSDEDLRSVLGTGYAVLYPPFNEDWGLVPLEAMALGKPVIAVNRGGPVESVVDGQTGFLVNPTPESFASAIEMLADDPDLVRRLGVNARARASEFDWSHFCSRLDTHIEMTVGTQASESRT
jgi:glycosyltransferase involved in cell wall biosynthesis